MEGWTEAEKHAASKKLVDGPLQNKNIEITFAPTLCSTDLLDTAAEIVSFTSSSAIMAGPEGSAGC
jgi:hypothetical protein